MHGAVHIVQHRSAIGLDRHTAPGLRIKATGSVADQEFEGLGVLFELSEKIVGLIKLSGRKSLCRSDLVQARLGGRKLLIQVGDRDEVRAAATHVEIDAMVEELTKGHQEYVVTI
jgi:hypothetical protein